MTGPSIGAGRREAIAENRLTTVAAYRMDLSANNPIMVVVPSAHISEEPGAVIPHAGICEEGAGQPESLP